MVAGCESKALDSPTSMVLLTVVYLTCALDWLYWPCPAFLCRGHLLPSSLASQDLQCIFEFTHKALHISSPSLPAGIWSCCTSSGRLIFPLKFGCKIPWPCIPFTLHTLRAYLSLPLHKVLGSFQRLKQPHFPWLQICTYLFSWRMVWFQPFCFFDHTDHCKCG